MTRSLGLMPVALVLALAGCSRTATVEVSSGTDDGSLSVLVQYLPQALGLEFATVEPARVGVGVSGGGDTLLARTLYRFSIPDWHRDGDITLHVYCDAASGLPGPVSVYVTDDFGELADITTPTDISAIWTLAGAGSYCGQIAPVPREWASATVSDSLVQAHRSGAGALGFMLRLEQEQVSADAWYRLATFERSAELGIAVPHLTWRRKS
jgi:hypothetical protein